ncbi:MAG: LIC_13355 family lipoprotein [Leptospirales bacterium]|nr:LIC_13355 family lipoprotein [Leptospirales bacterium]
MIAAKTQTRPLRYSAAAAAFCAALLSTCAQPGGDDSAAAALLLAAVAPSSGASCQQTAAPPAGAFVADVAASAPGNTGGVFYDVRCAVNGVRGAGDASGSTDVFSLNESGLTASMVLEWSGRRVLNGGGVDFVVYENAFFQSGNSSQRFMEAAIIEVSEDNISYCGFNPDYTNAPETSYSQDPTKWSRFAGINPVYYNQDQNPMTSANLFNGVGGGDRFDLANLVDDSASFANGCSPALVTNLKASGFVYLRIRAASSLNNPATAAPFLRDPGAFNGPDIDGAIAASVATR